MKNNNKFSLLKHFKETYITSIIIPVIAGLVVVFVLLASGYSTEIIGLEFVITCTTIVIAISVIAFSWFIFYVLNDIIKKEREDQISNCQLCTADFKKYLFARHKLLTFDEVVLREKKLKDHPRASECVVYNYTTLKDTVSDHSDDYEVEDVIRENKAAGVRYFIFYTDKTFIHLDDHNQDIYGEENLIFCQNDVPIYKVASFDYLIHKTPDTMDCYVAICFISNNGYCGSCPHKPCDYINDHIFYRKLPETESAHLYRMLNQQLGEHKTEGGTR